MERVQALVEVLLVSGALSSLLAVLPFSMTAGGGSSLMKDARLLAAFSLLEAAITMLILILILMIRGEAASAAGLRFHHGRGDSLLGLATVPILFALNILIALFFRLALPDYYLEVNPLTELIRTPSDLLWILATALVSGGIKEELQRAFILRRFQRHLGGAVTGLVVWSIAFGAGHYVQGPQGIVSAGTYGLIFGVLYLLRGSLVAPMVAHGAYNSLAIAGYWFSQHLRG